MAWRDEGEVEIEYPNRAKASSKTTKAVVIVLLLASAALTVIISVGGWSVLSGMKIVSLVFAAVYLVMAFFVARWKGGVLPVSAAVALVFGIFGAVSIPAWSDRTNAGYMDPALPSELLGTLTLILVVVQVLLIIASMRGFQQAWGVEIEHVVREREQRAGVGRVPPQAQTQPG